ncbi:hypothetical protein AC579_692 [Pseudocercospora musae]|uniref:Uncharacterized protein n=1 Tax=Pseudocercospora musae TaxID=113226 RepID=A0A139GTC9_9PEZI|nr:hypothetical protein AC579_692 [Pseudocercospora musae]
MSTALSNVPRITEQDTSPYSWQLAAGNVDAASILAYFKRQSATRAKRPELPKVLGTGARLSRRPKIDHAGQSHPPSREGELACLVFLSAQGEIAAIPVMAWWECQSAVRNREPRQECYRLPSWLDARLPNWWSQTRLVVGNQHKALAKLKGWTLRVMEGQRGPSTDVSDLIAAIFIVLRWF